MTTLAGIRACLAGKRREPCFCEKVRNLKQKSHTAKDPNLLHISTSRARKAIYEKEKKEKKERGEHSVFIPR